MSNLFNNLKVMEVIGMDNQTIKVEGTVYNRGKLVTISGIEVEQLTRNAFLINNKVYRGRYTELLDMLEDMNKIKSSIMSTKFGIHKIQLIHAMKTSGIGSGLKPEDILVDKTGSITLEYTRIYTAFITLPEEDIRNIIDKYYTDKCTKGQINTIKYDDIKLNRYKAIKDGKEIEVGIVNYKGIDNIYRSLGKVKWDTNAIEQFRNDLSDIYRFYQETIIDSAKKWVEIKLLHFFRNIRCTYMYKFVCSHIHADGDETNNSVTNIRVKLERELEDYSKMKEENKPVVITKTFFDQVKDKFATSAEDLINSWYAKDITMNDEQVRMIKKRGDNKSLILDIFFIKQLYTSITSEMMENLKNINKNTKDDDEIKLQEEKEFEKWRCNLEYLRKAIYFAGDKYGVDTKELLTTCIYVSGFKSTNNGFGMSLMFQKESTNSFASNILVNEYRIFANRNNKMYKAYAKVLAGKPVEGEYMFFINGICKDTIIDDDVTKVGKAVNINGKLYIEFTDEFKIDKPERTNKTAYATISLFKGHKIDVNKDINIKYTQSIQEFNYTYIDADDNEAVAKQVGFPVYNGDDLVGTLKAYRNGINEEYDNAVFNALIGRSGKITNVLQYTEGDYPTAIVEFTISKVTKTEEEAQLELLNRLRAMNEDTTDDENSNTNELNDINNNIHNNTTDNVNNNENEDEDEEDTLTIVDDEENMDDFYSSELDDIDDEE